MPGDPDPALTPPAGPYRKTRLMVLVAPSVAVLIAGLTLPMVAGASGRAAPSASTSITLVSQTAWLGQTGSSVLDTAVAISSPLSPSQLSLSINVYPRLFSLSDFEQTVAGQPVGNVLDAPPPIPLTELNSVGTSAPTAATLSLHLPVTAGYPSGSGSVTSPTLALDYSGDGVYPLQIAVVNPQFTVLSSFTTFLVYAAPPSGRTPLRLGWVLPLGDNDSIGSGGHYHISPTTASTIGDITTALATNPSVRMSFDLFGATADAIAAPGAGSQRPLLNDLRTFASDPSSFEFTRSTYVPVDADAMTSGDLTGEFDQQLSRGAGALAQQLGVDTSQSPWVSWGPLAQPSANELEQEGVSQFVLPAADISDFTCSTAPTCTQPFHFTQSGPPAAVSGSGPVVMAADPILTKGFGDDADPALDAQLLLANLAFVYFELPYDTTRGVVLETPLGWQPNLPFLDDFISGLQSSPIVSTYTLSQLLSSVAVGGNGQQAFRSLASDQASPAPDSGFPAGAIAQARAAAAAFSSVVPTLKATSVGLRDLILASEADDLSPAARLGILGLVSGELAKIGELISMPSGRTVTLTSSTAKVPISITSRASFPIYVVVRVSNPQLGLRFPGGGRFPVKGSLLLPRGTTGESIAVDARTSGDFSLRIEVVSPTGAVLLAQGDMTIRSTALSGVAIILSLGALLLLIVWWVRSSRRRRREAREVESSDDSEGPAGPGAPALPDADQPEPAAHPVRSRVADPPTAEDPLAEGTAAPGGEQAEGPPRSESPAPAGA